MIGYLIGAVAGVVERIRDEMRRRDEVADLHCRLRLMQIMVDQGMTLREIRTIDEFDFTMDCWTCNAAAAVTRGFDREPMCRDCAVSELEERFGG